MKTKHKHSFRWGWIFNIMIVIFLLAFIVVPVVNVSHVSEKEIRVSQLLAATHNLYKVYDTDGNVYEIQNLFFLGFYRSAELYGKMEVGSTYRIRCHGYRIPFLNYFPNITHVDKL